MVGKNNYKTRAEKAANKKQRFSLKKLSVGVASVAVGSTLLLGNVETVSAEDNEPTIEELQEALQTEKESAIAELQGIGIEDESILGLIRDADSVEEVKSLRSDIIDARQEQVSALPDQATTNEKVYDEATPSTSTEESTDEDDENDVDIPDLGLGSVDNKTIVGVNEKQQEEGLRNAKAEAIAEIQEAGYTEQEYADVINAQSTIRFVEDAKNEILATDPAEEEAQEEVYTLYYYGQRTQNQNGATTVEASNAEEAKEYFQDFLSENGLDANDFNWHYDEEDRAFTASEKIEGETSVDSEYDFNAPDIDWGGLEDAVAEEEAQEEVYTLYYYGQRTQNQNGATTVEASNAEEAKEYFQNFLSENGLDANDFNWHYDEEDRVFTASEKIEGETSVDSEYDFNAPDIDWSGLEDAVAEEEAQEEVYTLYYYGQRTQNQNGATTVKATSPREALEYFQDFLSENGLDAGDFNWHYESEDRVFTASEKIEGEASVDSEYDFLAPEFDWSGLEEATKNKNDQEEVYSFVYITQNTKGKNGATTVKASSLEEAKAYFQNWAEEHDLGDLEWSYDEETKTFTAHEKTEENTGIKGSTTVESVYNFLPDSELTWDELVAELTNGSDDSKGQEPGQNAPVKSGKGSEGQVATPVQDSKQATSQTGSQATGQGQAPAGQVQASGQAQASNQQAAEEFGQTLPDTATSTWALGLLGLSSLAGGLFAGKNKED